ncbi:peptidylprolyl isomerase fpr3 [Microbotryomycetes sp. JL221]|nr:peptidylprolyl isomerase fpr3 [Microbotryomycetes sp. JL221]
MALILGLWSAVLEPGKSFALTTNPGVQITNIAFGPEIKGNERSIVSIKYPDFVQDDSDDEDEDEDEEQDEDEEGDVKLPKTVAKEAVIAILKPNVTEQVSVNISLVEDVEIVELSVTGSNPVHLVGHYIRQEDFDQDPYSDDEYDSEIDSDFDEEDDDDEEGISGLIGDDSDDDMVEDDSRFEEVKEDGKKSDSKKRVAEEEAAADTSADLSGLSKNQRKKLAKKMKDETGNAAPAPVASEAPKKAAAEAPKKAAEAPKKVEVKKGPKTQTLAGGVVIVDHKEGEGPAAKSGSKVGMRYIGKLENGKVFDSNTKGAPLTFTLGRGEVIKGWDVGCVGLKVGGERKITIPASQAYGKQKLPGIPANSNLIFDVKLVSLKGK